MEINPIQTIYNGYRFRSRLEARWAVFFDKLGIEYEYEPEGIKEGQDCYLPDFYLPYFQVYVEIKRKSIQPDERECAIKKISYGMDSDQFAGLICFGDPQDNNIILYAQEMDDEGGGPMSISVEFAEDIENGQLVLKRINDNRRRTLFATWDDNREIPTCRDSQCTSSARIDYAKLVARQARFEHGEKP